MAHWPGPLRVLLATSVGRGVALILAALACPASGFRKRSAASPRLNVTSDTNGAGLAEKIAQKDREVQGKFFVFVKSFNMVLFSHSELAFCMQAGFGIQDEDDLGCQAPEVLTNGTYAYKNSNPGTRQFPINTEKPLDKGLIEHFGKHTSKCWITGFAGVTPRPRCFDEKKPVFYQAPSPFDPKIFYAGTVSFEAEASDVEVGGKYRTKDAEGNVFPVTVTAKNSDGTYTASFDGFEEITTTVQRDELIGRHYMLLIDFLTKMKACGNWENDDYSPRKQNCNDYAMTVLKALGLPTTGARKSQSPLAKPYLTDFGRWDVTKQACAGERCMEKKSGTCTRSCTIDMDTGSCRQ